MPRELLPPAERAAALNARYRHHGAVAVLEHALADPMTGRMALVSSFGAESVVLLHLVSVMKPNLPVLFLDTQMLFPETLAYQQSLAERLGLTDVRRLGPKPVDLLLEDPEGLLHQSDPDACCDLRKTRPLSDALDGFDAWVTGRKRFQGGARAALEFFEADPDGARIKINPLAHWDRSDVQDYIINNRLPRHPLVSQGFPSVGCAPCTTRVAPGEDPRAGRWRGSAKTECGIHFGANGVVRQAPAKEDAA